jgi:ATP-dependent helicase/nuclease subunit A
VESEFDSPYVMEALRRTDSIPELDDTAKDKLRRFLALFEELRARKDSVSPHELVKEALEATPYQTRLLTSPGGTQKMANVLKFLNILREYSAREAGGIGGFLQFYETMRFYGPREEAAPLEMYSGNTVKLMTIHAAKGLEFPVVVVADMSRSFNFDKGRFLISRETEIACDPWEESAERSCGRAIVFAERKEKQLAEERRLLYVAMTRARDYLILAGACRLEKEHDVERARSPLDWLIGVLTEEVSVPPSGEACEASFGEARVSISVNAPDATVPVVQSARSLLERYAPQIEAGEKIPVPEHVTERRSLTVKGVVERIVLRAASERPLSPPAELSVTQLVLFEVCPHKFLLQEMMNFPDRDVLPQLGFGSTTQPFPEIESLDLPSDVFTGVGGRRFGDRVHQCLEQIDLAAQEEVNVSEIVSRLFPSPEERGAAEELIGRFLRGEEACRLRTARELYREFPIKAIVDNVVIRGVVDVLYLDGDNVWTILDFKTSTLPPKDSSQWGAYRFQMSLYGFLLSEALSTPPQKAILYFLQSVLSESLALSREASGQTREKIVSIVRAIARGELEKRTGGNCQKCEYAALCLPECLATRSSTEGKA